MLEEAIIERLPARLRDAPAGDQDAELDQQVGDASEERDRLAGELENVEKAIREGGEVAVLLRMHSGLQGQWEEARATLRNLEARRAEAAGQTVQARIERLLGTLEPEGGDPLDVEAVNAAMLGVFRSVTIDYYSGELEFLWQHGGAMGLPFALPENAV